MEFLYINNTPRLLFDVINSAVVRPQNVIWFERMITNYYWRRI